MTIAPITRVEIAKRVRRPTGVRSVNASVILRLLIENGPMSRAEIAEILGLNQGTVTRIITELTDQSLVSEGERVSVSRGRPRVPIGVVPDAMLSIGLHIGVQTINAALMDLEGNAVSSLKVRHDDTVEGALDLSIRLINQLKDSAGAPLLGVGAISGGWVDPVAGVIRRHEVLHWTDVPVQERLASGTGLKVLVETSARAHALADILFGEARGHSNFAHVFVGHVIEASLVLDGRVFTGLEGRGGSLANWIMADGDGRAAPAWRVVSDGAIMERAQRLGIITPQATFDDLVAIATANGRDSGTAGDLLNERAFRVGHLIGALTDLFSVSLIVISSGVVALDSSIDHVRSGLEASSAGMFPPELRTEANTGRTLTRAATSVVLDATVLSGEMFRADPL